MQPRHVAAIAAVVGAVVLSCSGIIVRSMQDPDGLQIALFRATALIPAVVTLYVLRHRKRVGAELRRAGRWPFIAGPFQGLASLSFVLALTHTTVASAMVMLSATPLFAALIGWAYLKERVDRTTVLAVCLCSTGVLIVLAAGLRGGTIVGDVFALTNSLVYAIFIVVLRRNRAVDMLPSLVVGACITVSISLLLVPKIDLSTHDLLLSLLWGGVIQGSALTLLVFAARHLVAAELCLLTLLEFVLGPSWVWLLYGETPSAIVMAGGVLIISTVALWCAVEWKKLR